MLESKKKGDAVVIWDPLLPPASTGKVLLYNTGKDKLIEYVEEIVQPKLRDLTAGEMENMEAKFGARWLEVRSEYEPVVVEEEEQAKTPRITDSDIDLDIEGVDDDAMVMDDDLEVD